MFKPDLYFIIFHFDIVILISRNKSRVHFMTRKILSSKSKSTKSFTPKMKQQVAPPQVRQD